MDRAFDVGNRPLLQSILIFILLSSLTACGPTSNEPEALTSDTLAAVGDTIPAPGIPPSVRLLNKSTVAFQSVTIFLGDDELQFEDVAAESESEYQFVEALFQNVRLVLIPMEEGAEPIEIGLAEEGFEEPPIPAGYYSYQLSQTDGGHWLVDLNPDADAMRRQLMAPIEALEQAGFEVEHQPSIQRGTPFDQLLESPAAAREILMINGRQLDLYFAADEATAEQLASSIQLGGTRFVLEVDGAVRESVLSTGLGSQVEWWQWRQWLFAYGGNDDEFVGRLSSIFTPLVAETVPSGIELRVFNLGSAPFDIVTVALPDESLQFTMMAPRDVSAYEPVTQLYRYVSVEVEVAGELFGIMQEDYVDEVVVPAGRYTLALQLANGEIWQALLPDDAWVEDDALTAETWYWIATEGEGDWLQPNVAINNEQGQPSLTFTLDGPLNEGESGFVFYGTSGCNGIGGNYFVTDEHALVVAGIGANQALCEAPLVEREQFFYDNLTGISFYEIDSDSQTLRLHTHKGAILIFSPEEPSP